MRKNYTDGAKLFIVALFASFIGIIALIFFRIFPPHMKVKPYVAPEKKEVLMMNCNKGTAEVKR